MVKLAETEHIRPVDEKEWDRVLRAGRGVLYAEVICLDPAGFEGVLSDSGSDDPPEGWTDPDDLGDIVGGEFT
jgi:hypothetical protein